MSAYSCLIFDLLDKEVFYKHTYTPHGYSFNDFLHFSLDLLVALQTDHLIILSGIYPAELFQLKLKLLLTLAFTGIRNYLELPSASIDARVVL